MCWGVLGCPGVIRLTALFLGEVTRFQREIETMSERKSRRKSVNVTFSGDDDVVQHIVDSRIAKPGGLPLW